MGNMGGSPYRDHTITPRECPRDRWKRGDPHVVLWCGPGIVEVCPTSDSYHYVLDE